MSLPTDDHNAALPEWLPPADESAPSGASSPAPEWLSSAEGTSDPGTLPAPDWLASDTGEPTPPAEPERPAPAAEQPSQRGGMDEIFGGASEDGLPAWMSELSAEDDEPEADLPPWMEGLGGGDEPESEAPSSADVPEDDGDVFDWMSELSAAVEEPGEQAGDQQELPVEASPVAPSEPAPILEGEAEADTSDVDAVPDWLAELGMSGDEEAESDVPADSPSELPAEAAAPPAEAASPAEGEVPDWLSELSAPTEEPVEAQAEEEDEAPAWIKELGTAGLSRRELPEEPEPEPAPEPEPEPLSEEPEVEPQEEASVDDWLEQLNKPVELPSEEAEPPAAEEDDSVPDWLDEAFAGGDKEEAAEAEAAEEPDVMPEWLAETEIESEPPAEEAPAAEPEDEDLPDWMQSAAAVEPEEEQAAQPEEPADDVPDWMAAADVFDAEASQPEAPEAAAEPSDVIPDWLDGAAEPPTESESAQPVEAESAEPIDEAPAPPGPPPPTPAKPAAPGDEAYDLSWLDAINEAESAAPASMPEGGANELDSWLDSFDFDEAFDLPEGESVAAAMDQEDLLGLTGGALDATDKEEPGAEEAEAEATAAEVRDLPDWMRDLRGEEAKKPPEVAQPSRAPDEGLADRLQGLRYTEITGREPAEETRGAETVGALKDVSGVIQPEIIFEGSKLAVEEPVEEVAITEEQIQQIALVKRLLAAEAEPPVLEGRKRQLPVLRWVIVLVLAALAVLPLISSLPADLLPAPQGGPGVDAAYSLLNGLTAAPSTVLVAFEYEPDTAGELEPLAAALLTHLAEGTDTTVYTISTRPTGPAMAENVLRLGGISERVEEDGWVNLGYLPGRANGVHSLALGSPLTLSAPFAFDVAGLPSGIDTLNLAGGDVDLVVVLAARQEDLRVWVEQAGSQTDVPMLAAVSVRTEPSAQAYADGDQLAAVLAGVEDAAAYQARLGTPDDDLMTRRSVQAVVGGAAALLIVLGGLFFGLWSLRGQQERTR